MKRLLIPLILFMSCNTTIDPLEPQPSEPLRPTAYIESLKEGTITDEIIIQGSVTTSDSCGNFYQSMVIQDPTGAIELRFSFYDIYSLFKIGDVVSVKLGETKITKNSGLLSANIGSFQIASKKVLRQGYKDIIQPESIKIDDIDNSKVGKLVEISGGSFTKGGSATWSGEQKYTADKASISIFTSPFATYATETLPYGTSKLKGIVTIYNGKFQLQISSSDDCELMI